MTPRHFLLWVHKSSVAIWKVDLALDNHSGEIEKTSLWMEKQKNGKVKYDQNLTVSEIIYTNIPSKLLKCNSVWPKLRPKLRFKICTSLSYSDELET